MTSGGDGEHAAIARARRRTELDLPTGRRTAARRRLPAERDLQPSTITASPVGAPASGMALVTTAVASFEGALVPARFAARTRKKYTPAGSFSVHCATRVGVTITGSVVSPGALPPSIT